MDEFVFTLNKFNRPMEITDYIDKIDPSKSSYRATYLNLLRLLLAEPGTFPNYPDMGVGIVSNFKFGITDDSILKLKTRIAQQVDKYFPYVSLGDVLIYHSETGLYIKITTQGQNGQVYIYKTDSKGNIIGTEV